MNVLEIIGAVVVGLAGLAVALVICAILWGYVQATGGYIRASKIGRRYGLTLWKGRKPRLFALRMIHWQAWHQRTWALNGVAVPWTFVEPIRRERPWYGA